MRTCAPLLPVLLLPVLLLPALLLGGCVRNNYVLIVPQLQRPAAYVDPACLRPADAPPVVPTGAVVQQRRVETPLAAAQARVNGCAGVLYRIDPSGKPTDLRLLRESPPSLGYGPALLAALPEFRFAPSPTNGGWHYAESTQVFAPVATPPRVPFAPTPYAPPAAGNPFRT